MQQSSSTETTSSHRGKQQVYLIAIMLLALVLRFYHLGKESLWIDEGFSLRDAASFDFLHGQRPLYFAILREWIRLGAGHSELLMRLPSALFGVASVGLLYAIGRRLVGERASLIASFLMAISVLQINHSQEVRMYSLTVLLSLLTVYLLLQFMETGRPLYCIGYAASVFASLLTFPLTALILLAQGVFVFLYAKSSRPRSFIAMGAQVATAALWLPWLLMNTEAAPQYSGGYTSIIDKPNLMNMVGIFGKFLLWKWSMPGKMLLLAATGFSVLVLILMVYGSREFRRNDKGLAFILIWAIVPMVGTAVLSYTVANMWMVHYMIAASPAVYLLVGMGISGIRNRFLAISVAGLLVMMTMGRLGIYYKKANHPQWRTAVDYIMSHERPGDVIGIYYGGNEYVFDYYYRGKSRWTPLGDDEVAGQLSGWNDRKVAELMGPLPSQGKRFWLVLSNHTYAGGFQIIDYVKRNYKVLDHQSYHLMEMYLVESGSKKPSGQPKARTLD